MENFHEMLLQRHSIRRYTDRPIDPDDVKTIIEAALLAPTSKNARCWRFVVVEDRDTLLRLSECKPVYATSIKDARLAVVVTADPAMSEAYIEDAAIAGAFMHLQAQALGIGSCWVQVRGRESADGEPSEDIVREILDIPHDLIVECVITFGYAAETRKPVDPAKLQWEKVHIGTWRRDADPE
ncbi:MAG: nitroreductase family protein [Muribaculaceae bacterium]|nr:nitroreductase family protein [Muribaculaceae bacterium]